MSTYGDYGSGRPGSRTAETQHAELHAALDVLARRLAEDEARSEAAAESPTVAITYSHDGYKITVERSK